MVPTRIERRPTKKKAKSVFNIFRRNFTEEFIKLKSGRACPESYC